MPTLNALGIRLANARIHLLDQQALPAEQHWLDATEPEVMIHAIQQLKVRGAPLIGVAAALCLGLYAQDHKGEELQRVAQALRAARPTAVNLMWAIDRLWACAPQTMLSEALLIFEEDIALCQAMGTYGATLIDDGDRILTHCNSGGLATPGIGTALGVIRTAWEQGKRLHVYVDETRPLLQGARLTAWELARLGIPYTLISDNMAAMLMAQGKINKVFLGADRVAANGDFANKIGTYSVAVNAHYHHLPFYPVAPYSTIDPTCATGAQIPIEERPPQEVRGASGSFGNVIWAPEQAPVYNPSFDITPVSLVTALVTDKGIWDQASLKTGLHCI
jgi:methylthioribose-1-phosphate isomerase